MLTIGAFIQVPRPLHGDIADRAISPLAGAISKKCWSPRKLKYKWVGGRVPSHFNCIMIDFIWLSKCKTPTCWTSHVAGAEFNFLTLTCTTNKPSLSVHQVSWQGPTFSPVNSPNWSSSCKHSKESRNTLSIELNYHHELIARPAPPPPLLVYCCTNMDLNWDDMINELGFSQTCLARARQCAGANGLCHHEALHTHIPSNQMLSKLTDLLQTRPIWVNGGQVCTVPKKNKIWWGDQKSTSARQLKKASDSNRRLKQLPTAFMKLLCRTIEIVELSDVAIKSDHIRAKQCENQSIIHCLKSRDGIKNCTHSSYVAPCSALPNTHVISRHHRQDMAHMHTRSKIENKKIGPAITMKKCKPTTSHHICAQFDSICACARPAHRWCGLSQRQQCCWHCMTSYGKWPKSRATFGVTSFPLACHKCTSKDNKQINKKHSITFRSLWE